MNTNTMKNSVLLFLTAAIWGVAFVAQSVGMEYMGPFTFNGIRFLLGGTVLLPVLAGKRKWGEADPGQPPKTKGELKKARRVTLLGGICCGIALCSASLLQQMGIQHTTVAKAGFITALYIIIVPVLGLFFHKKVRRIVWAGVFLAVAGMYLLCIKESFSVDKGDFFVFLCAIVFSVHILVIDYFSPKADGVVLSCIQFYISGILCGIGGAFLSTGATSMFVRDMTAGNGFIALAVISLGNEMPYGVLRGGLVFGFANAIAILIETYPGLSIPSQFIQAIPYVATIVMLTIHVLQNNRKMTAPVKKTK